MGEAVLSDAYDPPAEVALLACAFHEARAVPFVRDLFERDAFSPTALGETARLVAKIADDDRPVDKASVQSGINGRPGVDVEYIERIDLEYTPNTNVEYLAERIRKKHQRRKELSALSAARLALEHDEPARAREHLEVFDEPAEAGPTRELDLAGLAASDEPIPPVPYSMRHPDKHAGLFVTGDVTALSGEGGVGKSTTALALALSWATGAPFAGFLVPEPGPVIYFDAENPEALIKRRWRQLVNGLGCRDAVSKWGSPAPLRYVWGDQYNLDTQAGFDAVRRLIDSSGARYAVFDSLIRYTRRNLSDATAMSELYLTRWRPLRDMLGGGLVYLAHLRKRSKESSNDPGQRLFGSVDLRNASDSHVCLEGDGGAVRVTHEKTRWDSLFPAFVLTLQLSPDGSAASVVYGGNAETGQGVVCEWLNEAGADGLLRQEVVALILKAGMATDHAHADKIATRALGGLVGEAKARKLKEQREVRYWLSKHIPDGVFNA